MIIHYTSFKNILGRLSLKKHLEIHHRYKAIREDGHQNLIMFVVYKDMLEKITAPMD